MKEAESIVLVVDDNKENLRVVSSYLKGKGYQIALSLNAENAYSVLQSNRVDLILLDVMMPGEDGYTFCRRIKAEEAMREIPVIFLTARTDTEDLLEGFAAGGVDYITKPFRRDELLARVRNHVDLARAKRDILEQAEIIRQINRTRDRIYSVISHDIKAPFANISMMVSMLAEGYLNPASDDFKEIIENLNYSTRETYTLLENLLQWTRAQTEKIESHPEQCNLAELVEHSLNFIALNATRKQIQIQTDIPADISLYVDKHMLRSVFRNLLSNAIKFTHPGGTVSILAKREKEGISVVVNDTGLGMNGAQLDRLFHANQFQTTAGTQNEKGSGLGLHLVHEFTHRNGGTISVTSEPGKGTQFALHFPFP